MEGEGTPWLQLFNVGGIIVALISFGALALQKWLPQKGSLEHQRIDQLQQDLEAERAEREKLTRRMDQINERFDEEAREKRRLQRLVQQQDLAWRRWHSMVEMGIAAGTIPPLIELPPELSGGFDGL